MNAVGTFMELLFALFFTSIYYVDSSKVQNPIEYIIVNSNWSLLCFLDTAIAIEFIKNVKKETNMLVELVYAKFKKTESQTEKMEVKFKDD